MSENEQDAASKIMPLEFQSFQEQAAQIMTHEPQTVDEKLALWTRLLEAWKYHLGNSPHQKQATTLLVPLLSNCSVFHYQRYRESKQRSDLDQSIELARELFQKLEDGMPDAMKHIEHLGFVLSLRYDQTYAPEDLTELAAVWKRARANADSAIAQAKYLYALGQTYKEMYRLFHAMDYLEEAVHYLEEAAHLDTTVTRNDPLNLLAFLLRERYQFTEDVNDLHRASLAWQESVSLLPLTDRDAQDKLLNISAIQARIYRITQQLSDLENPLAYWQEILPRIPDSLQVKAGCYNFLGYCFAMRFGFTHHLEDLDEAIRIQEQAIALATTMPSGRLDYLHNLHNMLTERAQASPDEAITRRLQQVEAEIEQLQREIDPPSVS